MSQDQRVRARFTVQSRTETKGWDSDHPILTEIKATAVTDQLDPESAKFFAATPSGELSLQTVVPDAAAVFVPGRDFYLDFSPVPGES